MDWPVSTKRGEKKKKDGRGGYRENAGRKPSSATVEERRRAALTGELPHQFLLRIMRGEEINGVKPDLSMRVDCAKAAAPYYAPKLSQVQVMESLSDDDLDWLIKNTAAEIGLEFGAGGESPQAQSAGGAQETTGTTSIH